MHEVVGLDIRCCREMPHLHDSNRCIPERRRKEVRGQPRALIERTVCQSQLRFRRFRDATRAITWQLQAAKVREKVLSVIAELDVEEIQPIGSLAVKVGHRPLKSKISKHGYNARLRNFAHPLGSACIGKAWLAHVLPLTGSGPK